MPKHKEFSFQDEWVCLSNRRDWKDAILNVLPDGVFSFAVQQEDKSWEHFPGTYAAANSEISCLGSVPSIALTFDMEEGKGPYRNPRRTLYYNPQNQLLTDFTSVCLAREDDAIDIQDALAKRKHEAQKLPKRAKPGKWKKVWEFNFVEDSAGKGLAVFESDPRSAESQNISEYEGAILASINHLGFALLDKRGRERLRIKQKIDFKSFWTKGFSIWGDLCHWGLRGGNPYLITYGRWFSPVVTFDLDGNTLFTLDDNDEADIESVAPIRLDQNNTGIAVGYRSDHLFTIFDPSGNPLETIEAEDIRNVSSARFSHGQPDVLVGIDFLSGLAISREGKQIAKFRSEAEPFECKALDIDGDGLDEILTLGYMFGAGWVLTAFSREGDILWATVVRHFGEILNSSIFKLTVAGESRIAVASSHGVAFFSTAGKEMGQFTMAITAAARLKTSGISDRLLLRDTDLSGVSNYRNPAISSLAFPISLA